MKKHGLGRKIVCGAAAFGVMLFCMLILLVLTAKIPQKRIHEKTLDSARFLQEGELFGNVIEGVNASKIDRYADSILLGIAWQYAPEHSLESVMRSAYYHTAYQNENDNLLDAVEKDLPANRQYLRYWHGSIAIVRPMLTVMSIQQIYFFNGIVLILLLATLLVVLVKKGAMLPAVAILAGEVSISVWFVPLSLEYTWIHLLTLALSVIATLLFDKRMDSVRLQEDCCAFFLIAGMLSNYLDFLTTELMTLMIPLLLILWLERNREFRERLRICLESAIFWGFGYVGTWIAKWILASFVLGENVMPYVVEHIEERFGGDIGVGIWNYLSGAVLRNMRCLFPWGYGILGMLTAIFLTLSFFYVCYVYRKMSYDKKTIQLYAIIGILPYIRFLVLHNHSYLHYFFTYRVQMGTIMAIVLIMEEIIDQRLFRKNK